MKNKPTTVSTNREVTITPKFVSLHHRSQPHYKPTSDPLGENPTLPRLTTNNKRRESTSLARDELCCKCTTTSTCNTRRCCCYKQDIPCTSYNCKMCSNIRVSNYTKMKTAHLSSLPTSSINKTPREKASQNLPPPCHAKSSHALTLFKPRDAYATNKQKAYYRDKLQAAQQKQGLWSTSNYIPLHPEAWHTNEQVIQTLPLEE